METDPPSGAAPWAGRSPGTVVARLTAKRAVRSGTLWGYIFGATVASSAITYTSSYKSPVARSRLAAAFGHNAAFDALFGPAHHLETVAGYTSYKCLGFLSIVGAIWGLMTGTKLLRGEEDAGRWELLLAGQTTRRGAAAQALAGLGAGLAVVFTLTAAAAVLVGRTSKVHLSATAGTFFALALVSSAAVFLAGGALASQLAATRRRAAAYAAVAFGACYALRMVADSGAGLEWLRWATPLGWVEQMQPLTAPDPVPLVPMGALVVVLSVLAVHLAGTRDLSASTFLDRSSAPLRTRLLGGPGRLAARLTRPTLLGWGTAFFVTALLMGYIAKAAGSALTASSSVEQALSRIGAAGTGPDVYLGVAFLIMAIMAAFMTAGQLATTRAEEGEGRLDHLLVRPVSRSSWFGGRMTATAAAVAGGGALAGMAAWIGTASQHAGVSITTTLEAGLNIVPPALCVLGAGALALGMVPRLTSVAVYGLVGWSAFIEFVGGLTSFNHWLLDTSLFHQMTAAPAVAPNWTVDAVLVGVGVAATLVGMAAFSRRDLVGE